MFMDNHLLSNRLKLAVKEKERRDGLSIFNSDLSRIAKTSRASVTNWMKDINKISSPSARLLGVYLSVNPVWLETGEGEKDIQAPHPLDIHKKVFDEADEVSQRLILTMLASLKK